MNYLSRRQFLGQTSMVALEWLISPRPTMLYQPTTATKPNIIFILADDLGYGDLGAYQQKQIQTPQLDKLAAEGMRFTNCYSGNTVCAPSRWSLMTGQDMRHAHAVTNSGLLYPEDVTVAQLLQQAGYKTVGIGKWGMGDIDNSGLPLLKGFDSWYGYFDQGHAHNYYPEFLWRNHKIEWIYANLEAQHQIYAPDLFTAEAVNFIQTNQQFPFFMYLPYTLPHANNELYNLTGDGMQVPSDAPYSTETWSPIERKFAAMVTRLDSYVGQILQSLQEHNLENDTLIFFTSDNGPHQEGGHQVDFFNSAGPLRGLKRDLYEGGIRVPMLVRWPNKIKPNTVSDHAWTFWDFLATIMDIIGVANSSDGLSIKPTLFGETQSNHEYLYWAFQETVFKEAVRWGEWKGVRNGKCGTELYHLAEDIGETRNLATQQPQILKQIEEIMAQYWQESIANCVYLPVTYG
jgi:arylsulfatase A-like enzyme